MIKKEATTLQAPLFIAVVAIGAILFAAISGSAMGVSSISAVSSKSNGTIGNGASQSPAISTGGDLVAFPSNATNFVTGDTNGSADIYMKNLTNGSIERIVLAAGGAEPNGSSSSPTFSGDDNFLAFSSIATNIITNDANAVTDVFIKNLNTGITSRVSTSSGGAAANGYSVYPDLSSNGRFVVFESPATNLVAGDTNGQIDVFIKDTETGVLERISTSSEGGQANGGSKNASISGSGRYVAFESNATNLETTLDTNSAWDVFVKDTLTGDLERASVDYDGSLTEYDSVYAEISPDGRYVLFESQSRNLVSDDTNNVPDIFMRDLETNTTSRVSVTQNGEQSSGESGSAAFSADGRFVIFTSYGNNLTDETFYYKSIFLKDLETGEVELLSRAYDGNPAGNASHFPAVSGNGGAAVFQNAADNMVSGDTNGNWDIFSVTLDHDFPVTTMTVTPPTADGSEGWRLSSPSITLSSSQSGVTKYQWDSTSDDGWLSYGSTLDAPAGSHTLYYRSIDNAGNVEDTRSQLFKVDEEPPADPATVTSSHAEGSYSSDSTIEMAWSGASDDASGVDGFSYGFTKAAADVPDATKDAEEGAAAAVSASLDDGAWYFHLRTKDNAGRWTSTLHYGPMTIDTVAPGSDVTLKPATADGENSWYLSSPAVAIASDEPGAVQYQWDSSDSSGWLSYGTTIDAPGGSHTLYYRSIDEAGNTGDANSRAIKADLQAPVNPEISSDHAMDSVSSDDTVYMQWPGASDDASGIDGYAYSFSLEAGATPDATKDSEETTEELTSASLDDGTWYFNLRTKDNAGRWSTAAHYGPFVVDTVAPETVLETPAGPDGGNGWYLDSPQIALYPNESGTTLYQWDSTSDSGWLSYGTTLDAPAGSHVIYYRSTDGAGNAESIKSQLFKVDLSEPADPSEIAASPAAGSSTSDTTIEVTWSGATDDESGVDGYSYSFTTGDADVPDSTKDAEADEIEATSDALADGTWYFHLRTTDNAGRSTSTVHYGPVTIDTAAPPVAFSSPSKPSGAYVNGTIPVQATASDPGSGLAKVTLLKGASTVLKTRTTAPYTFNLDTTTLSNGTRTIGLKATDRANNSNTALRSYKVDNYKPRTAAPYSASIARYKTVKLYYKISDPYSKLSYVTILIKSSGGTTVKTLYPGWKSNNSTQYQSYYAKLAKGTYYFYIRAKDQAGNTQYSSARNKLTIK